jgi:hypothetical protein
MVFLLGQMRKERKEERKGNEIDPRREFIFFPRGRQQKDPTFVEDGKGQGKV